jgi:hypothetical protein
MTPWPSISADVTIASAFRGPLVLGAEARNCERGGTTSRRGGSVPIMAILTRIDPKPQENRGSGARVRCPYVFGPKWDQIRNRSC